MNPALDEWCLAHRLGYWEAYNVEYYEIPNAVYSLAAANDRRAYDLFIRSLHAHNLMTVANAALGLARLQDVRAVDELLSVGRHSAGEALVAIIESLVYFQNAKAEAAIAELVELLPATDRGVLEAFRREAADHGGRGLFRCLLG